MPVKNKLLEIRLSRGYKKQKDFAEFLGLNQSIYNKFENNSAQPTLDRAIDICCKLNLKIEDVFYNEKL